MIFDDSRIEPTTASAEMVTSAGVVRVVQHGDLITWADGPDERWRYTDCAGHEHAYQRQAEWLDAVRPRRRCEGTKTFRDSTHYPTLRYVIEREHHCDGREGLYSHDQHWVTDAARYECRQCGEHIRPGRGPGSRTMPTGRETYLNGVPVTDPGRARELFALAVREAGEHAQSETAARVERSLGYPPGFGDK